MDWCQVIPNGLVESGSVYTLKSKNSLLLSHDKNQVIGAVGIEDLVVVSTRDAILVANKDASQDVKKIVETLILDKKLQGKSHKIDYRPWGNFESLINEKNFQVKTITVLPGESLSLQKHKYRSENWVVVKGIAKVTLDKQVKELNVGESIFIPKQAIHRLENEQHENLIIILKVVASLPSCCPGVVEGNPNPPACGAKTPGPTHFVPHNNRTPAINQLGRCQFRNNLEII